MKKKVISDSRKLFTREFTCFASIPNLITALHPSLLNREEAEQPKYWQQSCSDCENLLSRLQNHPGTGKYRRQITPLELQLHVPTNRISRTTLQCPAEITSAADRSCQWNLDLKKPRTADWAFRKGASFHLFFTLEANDAFLRDKQAVTKLILMSTCCSPAPSVSSTRAFTKHSEKRPPDPW